MAGWIKIDTEISKHWLWQDAERLKWWLDILFMASWKDRKQLVGKQLVALRRGQFIASLSFLCKRWGRSRSMVEPFLNLLQKEEMISKEVGSNISIITVLNYDKYQANNSTESDAEVSTEVSAYLEAPQNYCKSDIYDNDEAYLDAHLDADHKAHPDAHPDAHLDATREEYIDSKDNNIYNISSSLRSDDYSDKMSEQSPKIDLSKFIQFFNGEMDAANALIPKLRIIAGVRRKHILARCREFGKEALIEMVKKAARSDFLNGKNQKGWIADFSWLILPNNFPKVIEGNYDNKQNKVQDNGIYQQEKQDKRRSYEVEASSSEDYKTSF
jgi:hypothetical protein